MRAVITAYILPDNATLDDKKAWMWMLAFSANNSDETDKTRWSNLIASMTAALYPTLIGGGPSSSITKNVLTTTQVLEAKRIAALAAHIVDGPGGPRAAEIRAAAEALYALLIPEIRLVPELPAGLPSETVMWYAYFGVIIFAMVKDVNDTGGAALKVNRYRALKSKYGWDDGTAPMLEEAARPSDHAFAQINRAWVRLPELRGPLFRYLCRISEIDASVEDEAVFSVVRLMKYADLTHIALIGQFLVEYPWAVELPLLAGSVRGYLTSIQQLLGMCDDRRDAGGRLMLRADGNREKETTLLPYIKLLHSDKLDIAKREKVKPLLYLAHHVLKATVTTLGAYAVPEQYPAVLAQFNEAQAAIDAQAQAAADASAGAPEPLTGGAPPPVYTV